MYRILFALVELAAAGVFLLPLFLLYGKFTAHSRMQIFCSILFGFYFAAVLALVGFPSILDHSPDVTASRPPCRHPCRFPKCLSKCAAVRSSGAISPSALGFLPIPPPHAPVCPLRHTFH